MAAKYKSPRKAIPVRAEQAVLAKSARRCTLCFGLAGDLTEKLGQIAHLDGDRTNNAESNLAWMCLNHHSVFDSRTKQHKNYTVAEVKAHRKRLYALVARGERLHERTSRHDGSAPAAPSSALTAQGAKVTNSPVASGTNIAQTINSPTTIQLPDSWLELLREKKRLEADVEALEARPDLDNVSIDAPITAVRVMTHGEMRQAEQIQRKKKEIALMNEKLNQGTRQEKNAIRTRSLEIVFGGDCKPYFEEQPTAVLPGGRVCDRRYRIGVQNSSGAMVSKARVVLEDCEPREPDGVHLEHALQVMGCPGASEVSLLPSDKPTRFFDVVYDETLDGKLRGDAFGLCYATPVRLFAIPRGTYRLTLRVEGDGIQSRKKFKIFQDPTSQMLTMREESV